MGGKWEKYIVINKQFHEKIVQKRQGFRKLSHSSNMQNDALKHHEGLKG